MKRVQHKVCLCTTLQRGLIPLEDIPLSSKVIQGQQKYSIFHNVLMLHLHVGSTMCRFID